MSDNPTVERVPCASRAINADHDARHPTDCRIIAHRTSPPRSTSERRSLLLHGLRSVVAEGFSDHRETSPC